METYLTLVFAVLTLCGVFGDHVGGSSAGILCNSNFKNISGCSVCVGLHSVEVKHCPWFQTFGDYVDQQIVAAKGIHMLTMSTMQTNSCDREVGKSYFPRYYKLHNFTITDGKVMHVSGDTFDDLPDLEFVDLRNNCIAVLSQNLFRNTIRLKELHLAGNKIKVLPDSVFEFTAELKLLDLSYNLLEEIESTELFKTTKNLHTLNLDGNGLHTISHNAFKELKLLQHLNLSHNQLSFPYFSTCGNKSIVSESFSNDSIQMRIWLVTMALKSDRALIDLRYNNIRGVPLGGFNHNCNHDRCDKITLLLANNPLTCGCDTYDLIQYYRRKWPEKLNHSVNITEELDCTFPDSGQRKPLSEIDPTGISCDLEKCPSCPPKCTCKIYMLNNTVIVRCTGVSLKVMPEMLPLADENESELWFDHADLQNFSRIPRAGTVKVLSLHHNNISKLPTNFAGLRKLKVLELNDNHLEMIDEKHLRHIHFHNLTRLTLGNNPWNCDDCKIMHLAKFLRNDTNTIRVADIDNITCRGSKQLVRSVDNPLCNRNFEYSSSVYILFPILIPVMLLILFLLVKLYLWRKMEIKIFSSLPLFDDSESAVKMYDAFISYSHEDEKYVAELVQKLEKRSDPYKICLHSRDWTPGELIVKQIIDSVGRSRNTIIVLSPAYFKSKWCHSEFRIALTETLMSGNHKIIVIWFSDADPNHCELDSDFKLYFRTCTYLKYNDRNFLSKLEMAIGRQQSRVT